MFFYLFLIHETNYLSCGSARRVFNISCWNYRFENGNPPGGKQYYINLYLFGYYFVCAEYRLLRMRSSHYQSHQTQPVEGVVSLPPDLSIVVSVHFFWAGYSASELDARSSRQLCDYTFLDGNYSLLYASFLGIANTSAPDRTASCCLQRWICRNYFICFYYWFVLVKRPYKYRTFWTNLSTSDRHCRDSRLVCCSCSLATSSSQAMELSGCCVWDIGSTLWSSRLPSTKHLSDI